MSVLNAAVWPAFLPAPLCGPCGLLRGKRLLPVIFFCPERHLEDHFLACGQRRRCSGFFQLLLVRFGSRYSRPAPLRQLYPQGRGPGRPPTLFSNFFCASAIVFSPEITGSRRSGSFTSARIFAISLPIAGTFRLGVIAVCGIGGGMAGGAAGAGAGGGVGIGTDGGAGGGMGTGGGAGLRAGRTRPTSSAIGSDWGICGGGITRAGVVAFGGVGVGGGGAAGAGGSLISGTLSGTAGALGGGGTVLTGGSLGFGMPC